LYFTSLVESVINHAVQTLKLDLRLKYFKMALGVVTLIFLPACTSQIVAVGSWAEPSNLNLNDTSLSGVKISVRCAQLRNPGGITEHSYPVCAGLERHLAALGAKIITKGQSGADLTLWYIEQGVIDKHTSGGSVIGYVFTSGLIPVVSTATSRAELRVSDSRGIILDDKTLDTAEIRVSGWAALLGVRQRARGRDLGKKFYQYAENRVVSQAIGLKLAQNAKGEP
jgi:hypothetical protein